MFFSAERETMKQTIQFCSNIVTLPQAPNVHEQRNKSSTFHIFFDIMVTSSAEICCSEREKATQLGELTTRKFIILEQKKNCHKIVRPFSWSVIHFFLLWLTFEHVEFSHREEKTELELFTALQREIAIWWRSPALSWARHENWLTKMSKTESTAWLRLLGNTLKNFRQGEISQAKLLCCYEIRLYIKMLLFARRDTPHRRQASDSTSHSLERVKIEFLSPKWRLRENPCNPPRGE